MADHDAFAEIKARNLKFEDQTEFVIVGGYGDGSSPARDIPIVICRYKSDAERILALLNYACVSKSYEIVEVPRIAQIVGL